MGAFGTQSNEPNSVANDACAPYALSDRRATSDGILAERRRVSFMFSLRNPSAEEIQDFVAAQARLNFSYSFVGQTASTPPVDFHVNHTRVMLGNGEVAFHAATSAFERWEQFHVDGLRVCPQETPIKPGEVLAIVIRICGVWWLNACRIIYVIDDAGPIQRFGFAYGTLPDHAVSGQEQFLIEWDRESDCVWYDILAFSRPRHPLARLGYPFCRMTQKHFARQSAAAMLRAVGLGK